MNDNNPYIPKFSEFIDEQWEVWFLDDDLILSLTKDNIIQLLHNKQWYNSFWEEAYTPFELDDWSIVKVKINDIIFHQWEVKKHDTKLTDVFISEWTDIALHDWNTFTQHQLAWDMCQEINMPFDKLIKVIDWNWTLPYLRMCKFDAWNWNKMYVDLKDIRLVN